jgi:hypothetical protein
MPTTTRAAVILMAPELGAYPDGADWTQAIADASLEFPSESFGTRGEYAARLLVAHLITVRKSGGGAGGRVVSESIGGVVSRTYAQPSTTVDPYGLDRTVYGQQLLSLMRVTSGGPMVT